MTLTRNDLNTNGIFSVLQNDDGSKIAVTAEHSYNSIPKLPNGSYTCVKGLHTLEHHTTPFLAFEITNVPGHTNILLHIGNYPQVDSMGCVLLGEERVGDMVTNSEKTFLKFMDLMKDVDSFTLVVN